MTRPSIDERLPRIVTRVPPEVIRRIDRAAQAVGMTRATWLRVAVLAALDHAEGGDGSREAS